jgi:hypothetical protein
MANSYAEMAFDTDLSASNQDIATLEAEIADLETQERKMSSSEKQAGPETQEMGDDEIIRILGPTKGLLVRQKLDRLEIFCPALQKRNKYKVAAMPTDKGDNSEDWEDKHFKNALQHGKFFSMKEESECMPRIFCGSWREFTIKVTSSKKAGGTLLALCTTCPLSAA